MDSSITHKIKQLDIIDQTDTTNSTTELSHGVVHTDNSTDECINVNGTTSVVPITAHHPPTKTIHCTSLFTDMVEWLSTVVIGTLDGKVGQFTCAVIVIIVCLPDIMSQMCCQVGLLQLGR